ncbi:Hypothetical predicted protein [Paramuricea clavata]|uniref:CTHRC1 C-terminal domain-containing protein n=1 Tax=Paramuricea clavata TaxID=317549 RepID=A0A6S7G2U1_PARCT|nr:Hypothetical predicted protein [Paramuricea clavata]
MKKYFKSSDIQISSHDDKVQAQDKKIQYYTVCRRRNIKSFQRRLFRMKQSIISIGLILLSMVVLYAKATSTCSCSCGGHESTTYQTPLVKQCTFKSLNDDRNKGQIETCDFQKAHSNSALRVTYQGDLRMISCSNGRCCRRWFITINGKECSSPAPIDAHMYAGGVANLNVHRPGTLDGFCNNIAKGKVTVGLSVGKCNNWSYDVGDAYTCSRSVCRLIIEEILSMQ